MNDNSDLINTVNDDCQVALCTEVETLCDCELCRQCRDEQAALIGLNGTDADLRFVNSEVQR
jgi:hypothetical protein